MRGGPPNPIARPVRRMSAERAPTTSAIRSTATSGQLRHTNACNRSGKCGKESGRGAWPLGKSATDRPEDAAAERPRTGADLDPNVIPPVNAAVVLIKPLLDSLVVRCLAG